MQLRASTGMCPLLAMHRSVMARVTDQSWHVSAPRGALWVHVHQHTSRHRAPGGRGMTGEGEDMEGPAGMPCHHAPAVLQHPGCTVCLACDAAAPGVYCVPGLRCSSTRVYCVPRLRCCSTRGVLCASPAMLQHPGCTVCLACDAAAPGVYCVPSLRCCSTRGVLCV